MTSGSGRPPQSLGPFVPPVVSAIRATPPDAALVVALKKVSGLTAGVSDVLDGYGLRLVIPASTLAPLLSGIAIVGRAVTLRYLPTRETPDRLAAAPSRMAHKALFARAMKGDVAVIAGSQQEAVSLMGGEAAALARGAGLAGCVIGGHVRDIDELLQVGLPIWCEGRTPIMGKNWVEAVELNGPLEVAGVHVRAGDVVIADDSGVAFVPPEIFADVAHAILHRQ